MERGGGEEEAGANECQDAIVGNAKGIQWEGRPNVCEKIEEGAE
jgi:hypothetical protein